MDVAVIGATGKVGRRVATRLAQQGVSVRAASRRPEGPAEGIRGVRFDWTDPSTWRDVAEGADAIFVVGPIAQPDPGRTLGDFLAVSDAPSVVLLSSLATEPGDGSPNGAMEEAVVESGKRWTILRASWFMQNFSENPAFTRMLAERDEIPAAVGDVAISFVDTGDIADMAIAVLTDPRWEGRAYGVTGPEALTLTDAAEHLSRGLDRRITYENRSPREAAEVITATGVPEPVVAVLGFVDSVTRTGAFAPVSDDVRAVLGRPPATFADYAASLEV